MLSISFCTTTTKGRLSAAHAPSSTTNRSNRAIKVEPHRQPAQAFIKATKAALIELNLGRVFSFLFVLVGQKREARSEKRNQTRAPTWRSGSQCYLMFSLQVLARSELSQLAHKSVLREKASQRAKKVPQFSSC